VSRQPSGLRRHAGTGERVARRPARARDCSDCSRLWNILSLRLV
jgi:hypothetical protein